MKAATHAKRKKAGARVMALAHAVEKNTQDIQEMRNAAPLTEAERALLLRAEELGLKSAHITRKIALRMELKR